MKVAVVGSRSIIDEVGIVKVLSAYDNITEVVSGGAKGVDSIAEKYAKDSGIRTNIFLPEWKKYGKRAGFVRNVTLIDNSDMIIAFWDGISRGTKHSIDYANRKGKDVHTWMYKNGKWVL